MKTTPCSVRTLFSLSYFWLSQTYDRISPSNTWDGLTSHISYMLPCHRIRIVFYFAVPDRYSNEKMCTVSLCTVRWVDLSTHNHIKPTPGDLCLDEPIPTPQRCLIHRVIHPKSLIYKLAFLSIFSFRLYIITLDEHCSRDLQAQGRTNA